MSPWDRIEIIVWVTNSLKICNEPISLIRGKGVITMARVARAKSKTGIYHVMLRGIDKRDIFLTEEDYLVFLRYIEKARSKTKFTVYAYCLMTNHVHLLLKTEEPIGNIIKRVAVGYAQYHNIKNGRTGHLFQNRFKSEVVETDKYFLTVLRYINQNPVKAGLVGDMKKYKWSSYREYYADNKSIVEKGFITTYFNSSNEFAIFMEEKNEDKCLEYEPVKRWTDEGLKEFVNGLADIEEIKHLNKKQRDEVLRLIKIETKASNRQLERVLGIGRGILERIIV